MAPRDLDPDLAAQYANEALRLVDQQKALMIAVSTGGPRIPDVNNGYVDRRRELLGYLSELGIPDPNPHNDLWSWYGKWSAELPRYSDRRRHITELYAPLEDDLALVAARPRVEDVAEPTGWEAVDRGLTSIRAALESAESEVEFQAIGTMCRETMTSLAQAVFDSARHPPIDGVTPSPTDSKRMLQAYGAVELAGDSDEEWRRHLRSSIDLCSSLVHKRTATRRQAGICAESVRSLCQQVRIVEREAGR